MKIRASKEENVALPQTVNPEMNAFLGPGCEYDGKLTFEGSVRIDGKFAGEIFTNDILLVGEGAFVKAEIEVGTIVIQGTVEGNINAKKLVEIKAPAVVRGNIFAPSLVVEQGVVLEGTVRMEEKANAARKPVQAVPEPSSSS